ncbi:receptor activity-modifying protein 2 [Eretmochelys imbricata]
MALCREAGSGRLCPGLLLLLLLWAALGSELHPAGTTTSGDNESLAELQNQTATEPEQPYKNLLLDMTAAALGSELHPAGTTTSGDNESLAELQNQTATEPEQPYKNLLLDMTAAALGSELHPAGTTTSGDNESLAELQNQTATEPEQPYKNLLLDMTADEKYNLIAYMCWDNFSHWMMNITRAQLCEWRVISRPYSDLRHCLETFAEKQNYGYPNSIAEECIVQSHRTYFLNCTQEHPVFLDPPEDVLLALILAPICLIPFLVTLVVWRSKDGKMQS